MKQDLVLTRGAVTPEVAAALYVQLFRAGIPAELAVPFLVRARGWRIADFCSELGIHRSYFNALLRGQHRASLTIHYGVRKRLGFDPWRDGSSRELDFSTEQGDPDRLPHSRSSTMTLDEIAGALGEKLGIPKAQAGQAVHRLAAIVAEALQNGERVALPNLGTFSVATRPARKGSNPRTGEPMTISARKAVKFSAASALGRRLNGGD